MFGDIGNTLGHILHAEVAMPWQEVSTMSLRREFVMLAQQEDINISELCRIFNISRKTGYKWLMRVETSGADGLRDLSRRPHFSPLQTPAAIEDLVVELRKEHPAWGGRKLKARLLALGHQRIPAASTITGILRRHNLLNPDESQKHAAFIRFEHPEPNDLWQLDFKGHFAIDAGRCHPLTAIDDHSRFNIVLKACPDQKTGTVQNALIEAFRRYGLPRRMTMDNGSPWGNKEATDLTPVTVMMIRLGIRVTHSRPYHPQTQGKDERFHRTLKVEAITGQQFRDLNDCQAKFDRFRDIYNLERPHDSLDMKPPVTRYRPSPRPYPEQLPSIEYGPDDHVRKVQAEGLINFKGTCFRVPKALRGNPIALRPKETDGVFDVYFCHHKLMELSLRL